MASAWPAALYLGTASLSCVYALGAGATDALLGLYLIDTIASYGGTRLVALGALAAAAGVAVLLAPAGEAAADLLAGGRKPLMVTCHAIAACAVAAFGVIAGANGAPDEDWLEENEDAWQVIALAVLAAVHRLASVAASSGTTLVQAAAGASKSANDAPDVAANRQAVLLAWAYTWNKVGAAIAVGAVVLSPKRNELLWFLGIAAFVRLLCLAITAAFLHRPEKKPTAKSAAAPTPTAPPPPQAVAAGPSSEVAPPAAPPAAATMTSVIVAAGSASVANASPSPKPPTVLSKVRSGLYNALVKTPQGLRPLYVTCALYGAAYGSLSAIRTPYFSEVIFQEAAGGPGCIRWSAITFLLTLLVAVLIDAAVPPGVSWVGARVSRCLWPMALVLGGGLFVGLATTTSPIVAMSLFVAQAIPMSIHVYLSLVISTALAPSQKAVTRSMILAATQLGFIAGALLGGVLADHRNMGIRDVMIEAGVAAVLAAVAAMAIGPVPVPEEAASLSGIITNGNALAGHLRERAHNAVTTSWSRFRGRAPPSPLSSPTPSGTATKATADGTHGGHPPADVPATIAANNEEPLPSHKAGGGTPYEPLTPSRNRRCRTVSWAEEVGESDWEDDEIPAPGHRRWRRGGTTPRWHGRTAEVAAASVTSGGGGGDGGGGGGGGGGGDSAGATWSPWPLAAAAANMLSPHRHPHPRGALGGGDDTVGGGSGGEGDRQRPGIGLLPARPAWWPSIGLELPPTPGGTPARLTPWRRPSPASTRAEQMPMTPTSVAARPAPAAHVWWASAPELQPRSPQHALPPPPALPPPAPSHAQEHPPVGTPHGHGMAASPGRRLSRLNTRSGSDRVQAAMDAFRRGAL
ncbi:hypothetical protein MMPV_005517 [Pyropia vietnamensis]